MVFKYPVLLGIVTLLAIGLADFMCKRAVVEGAPPILFVGLESLFMFGFAFVAAILIERSNVMNKAVFTYAPITALLLVIGLVSLLTGLQTEEASTLVPIARLGFSLTFVLALAFLGESLTPVKMLGLVFAVLAVLLLSS